MLDIILIVILLGGFLVGLKRGFVLQIVHLTGFFVSIIVAYLFYGQLAPHLKRLIPYPNFGDGTNLLLSFMNAETFYYNGIAFVILFIGTKIAMRILGSMLNFLVDLPILRSINRWSGGFLGFLEIYLIVLLFLIIGAVIPSDSLQSAFENSFVAQTMIKHTPFISSQLESLWIGKI